MNIKCYTLYDITRSNITHRKKFTEIVNEDERRSRSQQSNFETILQIINMRSQPENISDVEQYVVDDIDRTNFGYLYAKESKRTEQIMAWKFMFSIDHPDVFHNGVDELGYLLHDCEQVPMITGLGESFKLSNQMNITTEMRNIYFEIVK